MQTNVSVTADPAAETTMKKRNTLTIGDQLKSYARHPGAGVLAFLTLLGAVITFALLFFLIGYVLVKGIPYLNASLFSLTYTSERFPSPVTDQYSDHDTGISGDCRSGRNLCSDLPCGICKKRQPFCKADPYYRRDTFRYSIYRIWSVRYAVLCNCTALGHVSSFRCADYGDHGTSPDHAYR